MGSEQLAEGILLGGRYQVQSIVGRGGMGTVYRAHDMRLDMVVAVKEMDERRWAGEDRDEAVRQFEREAKLLGQLSHPNLPRVTDYFVDGERWYLVMEFVEGSTLEARLREAGGTALPFDDVLTWGIQLADVLAYLHSQSPPVVFRDMKPANVMLQADGTVRLIDFGIARRFQDGATKDTLLYGSPGYSPPEQYGRSQTDPRSDIYALGATLHHLLTGRDPAASPFRLPPLRSIDPSLPSELEELLRSCVEMDVDRRTQTAAEVRRRLLEVRSASSGVSAHRPAASLPAQAPRQAARPGRTTRRAALLLGVVAAAAVIAVLAQVYRPHRPRPAPPPASPTLPPASAETHGEIQVSSTPAGARVFLDGSAAGVTPVTLSRVATGTHSLQVVAAPEAGLAPWQQTVAVGEGLSIAVDAALTPAGPPQTGGPSASLGPVQARLVLDQALLARRGISQPSVLVTASARLAAATGKTGSVAVFFYGADPSAPLAARPGTPDFANRDGQLSVSQSFRADTDPYDVTAVALAVPAAAFPDDVAGLQVRCRVIVYVDGKPVGQSDLVPVVGAGPGNP